VQEAWVNQNLKAMKTTIIYLLGIFLHLALLADTEPSNTPVLDLNLDSVKSSLLLEAEETLDSYAESSSKEKPTQEATNPNNSEDLETTHHHDLLEVAIKD